MPYIVNIRMEMPRIGTRKLYFLLQKDIQKMNIKIGRDALFDYLRSQKMLVKPIKSYTRTTNSSHWLHKYPNLFESLEMIRPDQVYVSDIGLAPYYSDNLILSY